MSAIPNNPTPTTFLSKSSLLGRMNTISEISTMISKQKQESTSKDLEVRTVTETLKSIKSASELVFPAFEGYNTAGYVKSFSWCLTILLFASLLFM